jgi:hypothetical protein
MRSFLIFNMFTVNESSHAGSRITTIVMKLLGEVSVAKNGISPSQYNSESAQLTYPSR